MFTFYYFAGLFPVDDLGTCWWSNSLSGCVTPELGSCALVKESSAWIEQPVQLVGVERERGSFGRIVCKFSRRWAVCSTIFEGDHSFKTKLKIREQMSAVVMQF